MLASPNDLVYFIEVAQTLNLSRASERLGISQPSLSQAIKRLEQNLQVPLLIRSKNGVQLTQAGKNLLLHANQLMQLWNTIKSETLASHTDIQGSYIFGCHVSVALSYLSQFLPDLLCKHPKLEIQLVHDLSRKIVEGVINLSIDIGLVINPIRHPDLIIQKLHESTVGFWAVPQNIDNLSLDDSIIICDSNLLQCQWLLKQIQKEGRKYQRIITSTSLEVIANLCASGCGVGVLPESVAKRLQLQLIPNLPTYQDEVCLVYRHENRHLKTIQVLIDSIKHIQGD